MNLAVLLSGKIAGTLKTDGNGKPSFAYSPEWLDIEGAYPLSVSLPLRASPFSDAQVSPVLWGLLPDNETLLQRWGSHFHVSPRNPVALLANVGEDCAGAVQFVRPDRVADVLSGTGDALTPLKPDALESIFGRLRSDRSFSPTLDDIGQFTLAGAQSKVALHLLEDGTWAIPKGRVPTTHILKPPSGDFDGYVENEMFCLRLASKIGLPSAHAKKLVIGAETAICVERYDRFKLDGEWLRIHQEDFCQALAVMPHIKYQNQGGPGPAELANVLAAHSAQPGADLTTVLRALMFNRLIGGTDAHAKNYSILFLRDGTVRLAPLYDISSALPYPNLQARKLKMAMKIGSNYKWSDIRITDWQRTAESMNLDGDRAVIELAVMADALRTMSCELLEEFKEVELSHPVLDRLVIAINASCERLLRKIESPPQLDLP